ncbi:MAG: sodium-translocating pyrophosphatase, partial [Microthrixaceae bacterium]|nr:sodium-translocating pyrophosphatase [Microthrixaceae bacterium]
MQNMLAEGGYQEFSLAGQEWFWLVFCAAVAVIALVVGWAMMRGVLAKDAGSEKMNEIAGAVQEGAMAYIKRQFRTILIIVVPLAVVVFVTSAEVLSPSGDGLSRAESGLWRTLAFLLGAAFSGFIGYLGMWLATRANVRTAAAAQTGSMDAAMQVAFRSGGTIGLFTAGLGLLGATLIVMVFQNTASAILVGFGFGGSLLALFLRVGGGIFTKAADVGADLVGKVEAGIPEDDPRNPATIADNVGDNVGDCAGMASDLFESFGVVLVANIILGVTAFNAIGIKGEDAVKGLIFPLAMMGVGLLASMVSIYLVKARPGETDALRPINRGLNIASLIMLVGAAVIAFGYVGSPEGDRALIGGDPISGVGLRMFVAIVVGVILGQVASRITQYFTSSQFKPVKDIAEAGRTGPATVILSGISSGLESAVWAVVAIAVAILVGLGLGDGNILFAVYLVALTGIGMLSTTGIVVAEDTFGPIADNAQGIAEMSEILEGETETILDGLDTVGNTTKAVTKGFAIGSAVIAAVALFASFRETVAEETDGLFDLVTINIADPKTFAGGLIGGTVVFLFSSLAILAVGRTAGIVVQEVRRQFREKPGIMEYTEKPDYGPVIDICTGAALRELATPALLAVLMPVVVGFGLGTFALGGYLAAIIVVGALMANFLSNAGGAWDNGKKYIEEGNLGGKGSEAHTAVVIGDTVGDPFKDTAGPAISPLIKVMNLVSLLVLPAIIALEDNNVRYLIAGVALVVILAGVWFSKSQATSFGDD